MRQFLKTYKKLLSGLVTVVFLIIFILGIFTSFTFRIFPSKCSETSTAPGFRSKICECRGTEWHYTYMGGGFDWCFGVCENCKCYKYNQEFPCNLFETYLLDKKYCEQDSDCVGTCELECVNKYNAPAKEPPCYAIPVCECVNNKCVQKQPEKKVEEETANWKTYRNEKYGFEVKYPSQYQIAAEWKEQKTEDNPEKLHILFQASDDYLPKFQMWGITLYTSKIKEGVGINDLAKSISLDGKTCEESFFISQNIPVVICHGEEDPEEREAFFARQLGFISPQRFLFEVEYLHNDFYNNEAIINQLLSTFRFSP